MFWIRIKGCKSILNTLKKLQIFVANVTKIQNMLKKNKKTVQNVTFRAIVHPDSSEPCKKGL